MKNVALSLLAAAGIGTISISSASAMPISNLAGLSESHVQDVRLVCDRFGRCYTRAAPIAHIHMRSVLTVIGYYSGYGPGYGHYGGPRVGIGVGPVGVGIR